MNEKTRTDINKIEGNLSYVDLAYALGKIFDNKDSLYLHTEDDKINLLCLSNNSGTAILDLNRKSFCEVSVYTKIEEIVDFTSTLYIDNETYNFTIKDIKNITFNKFENNNALLSVDEYNINIPDYFLPERIEEEKPLTMNLSER
jgi:hypothetical protein